MKKNPFEIDFEEYIRHTDASKRDKIFAWSTAIGLQKVDGLNTIKQTVSLSLQPHAQHHSQKTTNFVHYD